MHSHIVHSNLYIGVLYQHNARRRMSGAGIPKPRLQEDARVPDPAPAVGDHAGADLVGPESGEEISKKPAYSLSSLRLITRCSVSRGCACGRAPLLLGCGLFLLMRFIVSLSCSCTSRIALGVDCQKSVTVQPRSSA